MSSSSFPARLAGDSLAQLDLVNLQRRHAAQEERHRECPAVNLVRDHLARQAQTLLNSASDSSV